MLFGIEQNVFQSPFSLLVSIILSLGVIKIGTFFQKIILKILKIDSSNFNIFFSPIIGVYFLLFPLYLSLIFEIYAILLIKLFSYCLFILGIFQFVKIRKKIKDIKIYFKKEKSLLLIILIFFLLLLISASPITHADSVDYHFLGALNLINLGHFHKEILPMHLNLVSIGEIIISLGLVLKAEQFSAMIQTISLLALIPLFKNKNSFLILILTCPITFFLVSSPKPQLIFCISSLLIFSLLSNYSKNFSKDQLKIIFPLILLVLSINTLSKYSFLLSSTLLGIFLFYRMYEKKLLAYSILNLIIIFLITFLPNWLFRYENFNTNLIDIIQSPLPINIYGYERFHNLLSGGSISILGVFFPKDLQTFSTTYGPLILLFPFLTTKNVWNYKKELSIVLIFYTFVFIFGSNLPRFLYEGFLWLTYLISRNVNIKSIFLKVFNKIIILQAIIIIPVYIFFVISIFPASIFENLKYKILSKTVYGYELAEWTNKNLNNNDILLSSHRSISLYKNKTFSNLFTRQIDIDKKEAIEYFKFLKEKKVNRILFYGKELDKEIYKNCLGKLLFFKKDVGRHLGRNPFNRREAYNGWIFELNYNELPGCIS